MAEKKNGAKTRSPRPTATRLDAVQTQLHGMRAELKDPHSPNLYRAYVAAVRALEDLGIAYAERNAAE